MLNVSKFLTLWSFDMSLDLFFVESGIFFMNCGMFKTKLSFYL